jgi:hypothetical protein
MKVTVVGSGNWGTALFMYIYIHVCINLLIYDYVYPYTYIYWYKFVHAYIYVGTAVARRIALNILDSGCPDSETKVNMWVKDKEVMQFVYIHILNVYKYVSLDAYLSNYLSIRYSSDYSANFLMKNEYFFIYHVE